MELVPHKNYTLVREFIACIPTHNALIAVLLSLDPRDYFIAECPENPNQQAVYTSNKVLYQFSRAMEVDCTRKNENNLSYNTVGCMFSTVNLENKYIPGYLYYK